jgi:hypothetical protein
MTAAGTKRYEGFIQRALGGVAPATAEPLTGSKGHAVSTLLWDETASVLYQVTLTALGARVWSPIGGAGLPSTGWGKYVVSPTGSVPSTLYATVTAAIAAALADGHDAADPAVILHLGGSTTEDFTLPCGISLVAFKRGPVLLGQYPDFGLTTQVNGIVTVDSTGGGAVSIAGVEIVGSLVTAGAGVLQLLLEDVYVENAAGVAISFTGVDPTSKLSAARVQASSAVGVGLQATAGSVALAGGTFAGLTAGASFADCTVTAGDRAFFDGGLDIGANCDIFAETSTVFAFGRVAIAFAGITSTAQWTDGVLDTDTALTSGAGALTLVGNVGSGTGSVFSVAAASTSSVDYTGRPRYLAVATAAGANTYDAPALADFVLVQGTGANSTYNLPPLATQFHGKLVTVKMQAATGDLAVTPPLLEVIDGLAAGAPFTILAGATGFQSQNFVVDRVRSRWWSC